MDIPIVVISYNNHKYVENTLKQIKKINPDYYKNIIIVDNFSTCNDTIQFLQNVDVCVIRRDKNYGPRLSDPDNFDIYARLPPKFVLTDPDLQFNENLPSNFIDILSQLSDQYQGYKVGFALDISDFDKMFQSGEYKDGKSIYGWESQFWEKRIPNSNYELYDADIDTTFCLMNKYYLGGNKVRVAGNFTAKHLPWYIDNTIYTLYETYLYYTKQTDISSNKKMMDTYFNENFTIIHKNNELILLPKTE
jgi:hypothetical protein